MHSYPKDDIAEFFTKSERKKCRNTQIINTRETFNFISRGGTEGNIDNSRKTNKLFPTDFSLSDLLYTGGRGDLMCLAVTDSSVSV